VAVPQRALIPAALRAFRWSLVVLLALSVMLTLFAVPELRRAVALGAWPKGLLAVPPLVLATFVLGFACYRAILVRLGRYEAGKAFVQVGLMFLVLMVVAKMVLAPDEEALRPQPVSLAQAFHARDSTVRALAAEVARYRPHEEGLRLSKDLAALTEDPSVEVRGQARASLKSILGRDAGEGPGAEARWQSLLPAPTP